MADLQIGFANIEIIPFSDSLFTPNPGQLFLLTPNDFDSADEQGSVIAKDTTTLVRGDGGKDVYENPNPESGILTLNVLNPIADRLQGFMFPDSNLTIDGAKIKREYFDNPGQILSTFDKAFKIITKPLTAQKVPVAPSDGWLTYPRAVIVPAVNDTFSSVPGKTGISIISLGGRDPGLVAIAIGDVDISGTVDLSAGGTDKLIDLTIEGTLTANINFGQSAAATGTSIIDAINNAVGTLVASIDTNGFLNIKGFQAGGTVTVDDPTAGISAFLLVYQSGGSPPDTVNGTAAFDVPVAIRGDETAV